VTQNYNYVQGEWNVICDVCGFKFKSSQLKKRWDGFMVCKDDWETPNPQQYARVPRTEKPIPWARPEPADHYIDESIDCALIEEINLPAGVIAGIDGGTYHIYKARTIGPVSITNDTIVVVHCEWAII